MPTFEIVPLNDAMLKSATGPRARITAEYLAYINELEKGRAGRLQLGEGETVAAVRRRLGVAAKIAGKELVVKRSGDTIFFYQKTRRGRRRVQT